jgi:hypothetical protein
MSDRDKTLQEETEVPKPLQVRTDPGRPIDTSRQLLRGLNQGGDPAALGSLLGGVPVEKNVVIEVPKEPRREATDPGPIPVKGPSGRALVIGAGCILMIGSGGYALSTQASGSKTLPSATASLATKPSLPTTSFTTQPPLLTTNQVQSAATLTPQSASLATQPALPSATASAVQSAVTRATIRPPTPKATTTARPKPTATAAPVPAYTGKPILEDIE